MHRAQHEVQQRPNCGPTRPPAVCQQHIPHETRLARAMQCTQAATAPSLVAHLLSHVSFKGGRGFVGERRPAHHTPLCRHESGGSMAQRGQSPVGRGPGTWRRQASPEHRGDGLRAGKCRPAHVVPGTRVGTAASPEPRRAAHTVPPASRTLHHPPPPLHTVPPWPWPPKRRAACLPTAYLHVTSREGISASSWETGAHAARRPKNVQLEEAMTATTCATSRFAPQIAA